MLHDIIVLSWLKCIHLQILKASSIIVWIRIISRRWTSHIIHDSRSHLSMRVLVQRFKCLIRCQLLIQCSLFITIYIIRLHSYQPIRIDRYLLILERTTYLICKGIFHCHCQIIHVIGAIACRFQVKLLINKTFIRIAEIKLSLLRSMQWCLHVTIVLIQLIHWICHTHPIAIPCIQLIQRLIRIFGIFDDMCYIQEPFFYTIIHRLHIGLLMYRITHLIQHLGYRVIDNISPTLRRYIISVWDMYRTICVVRFHITMLMIIVMIVDRQRLTFRLISWVQCCVCCFIIDLIIDIRIWTYLHIAIIQSQYSCCTADTITRRAASHLTMVSRHWQLRYI